MNNNKYLIIHKDHNIDVHGINSGAEMATLSLAKYLKLAGKEVYVAGIINKGDTVKDGVQFWDIGETFNVSIALQRISKEGKYHLISGGRALPILESRNDVNCVSRTLISHDRQGNDTGIEPSILTRVADNVIAVSNVQSKIFETKNSLFDKVKVVHYGVDQDIFKLGTPEQRDYNRIIFAGALIQDKGIHLLIPVFNQLKAKYPEIFLDIYGSASLWDREEFIDEKAVQESCPGITFHGKVKQTVIADAYANSGICAVPSIWFDPCPLTSSEAISSGCPVVAFNVGGLGDVVINNENGLLVEDISEQGLYNALDSLLANREILKTMSAKAIEKSRPYFRWERTAKEIIELCDKAAEKNQSEFNLSYEGLEREDAKILTNSKELVAKKIGVISTWNQKCGLATYAKFMFSEFPENAIHIFAEDLDDESEKTEDDNANVSRCWKRGSPEYGRLLKKIEEADIGILHLNCQYRFFPQPFFADFISQVKALGIKVVALLHTAYTLDPQQQQLVQSVDKLIVHSPVNRLEIIANGAKPEAVSVVKHGVDVKEKLSLEEKSKLREELKLPQDEKILLTFGFIQPHKGMEAVIEAVGHLKGIGIEATAVIAGMPLKEDPGSTQYLVKLKKYAEAFNVSEKIIFLNKFLENNEVTQYLQVADLVFMNYLSQHYEASGACSLAIGAGAIVATSIAPTFQDFEDSVWHLTSGYPSGLTAEILTTSSQLRDEICNKSEEYRNNYSWSQTRKSIEKIYNELGIRVLDKEKESNVNNFSDNTQNNGDSGQIKVLIQNRQNTFTQPGGDTIVVNQLKDNLTKLGLSVTVDVEGIEDPINYDLVHLFNFALPDNLRLQALRASASNTPFVVSSLSEDIPSFHNQSHAFAKSLIDYVNTNQTHFNIPDVNSIQKCERFKNDWTVRHAKSILANGEGEKNSIIHDYPNSNNIEVVKLAHSNSGNIGPELFVTEYGIKDFVLCVGRIESRKNQLMLLKALEDSDLTVVIAGGGFSYQPDYERAVHNFKRKGKTIILGRLENDMLESAYAAAKVHALPSWFELPGLVSLEAAANRCNIVACDTGTTKDYLGDSAFYCNPHDIQSIANAVLAAYYSPFKEELLTVAREYNSWEKVAKDTIEVYSKVLGKEISINTSTEKVRIETNLDDLPQANAFSGFDYEAGVIQHQEILEKGEICARNKKFDEAFGFFNQVLSHDPKSVRALRGKGAIYIAQNNFTQALEFLEKAYDANPRDAKTLSGLGMCSMQTGAAQTAYEFFIQSLKIEPNHLVTILQFVECSYFLNKFEKLEQILRNYLNTHSDDVDMHYCLAGATYKLNKLEDASNICKKVLLAKPEHLGAKQLLEEIEKVQEQTKVVELQEVIPESAQAFNFMATNANEEVSVVANKPSGDEAKHLTPALGIIEMEVLGIEEAKRRKKYDDVLERINKVRNRADASEEVMEKIKLIEAEVRGLQGDIQFASRVFQDILDSNPKSARALCGKGAIEAHSANWNEARNYFTKALTFDPKNDVAFAGLGLCSVCESRHEDAWDYYEKALASNPENMRALLGIVELGYSFGDFDRVEKALCDYLEMHPADIEMLYSLAGCYYKQERFDEALDQINKILLFRPDHVNALELREMIENIDSDQTEISQTTLNNLR